MASAVPGACVRAGHRPPAGPRVGVQTRLVHRRQIDGRLPVPELADVEVVLESVEAHAPLPAEEDVDRCLGQPLAADDAFAVVLKYARAQVRLQHRRLRLLHLQHERILPAPADEQEHPRACADAPDSDDLAGHVDESVRRKR